MFVGADMNQLGEFLREIIAQRNMTYDEVASVTGVKKTTINDLINQGTQPRIDTLQKLAAGLKLSPRRLVALAGLALDDPPEDAAYDAPLLPPEVERRLTPEERDLIVGLARDLAERILRGRP